MTLEEMRNEVVNLVQDPSFDNEAIDRYINEAFALAASELNLPDLKRPDVITTVVGQSYANLAALTGGFNGRISKVLASNVEVYGSLEELMTATLENGKQFGTSGSVERMALEGKTVWYDPIPDNPVTIPVVLYGSPPALSADSDEVIGFPMESHRLIGVHGAAMIMYDFIEDGVEGEKVNTLSHERDFRKGVLQVKTWIARNRKHNISSRWSV